MRRTGQLDPNSEGWCQSRTNGSLIFYSDFYLQVPIGKKAFFPGELVHTNELMVLLGENYFAERSAVQATEIVDRRCVSVPLLQLLLEHISFVLNEFRRRHRHPLAFPL
jgi:hypothetical protein